MIDMKKKWSQWAVCPLFFFGCFAVFIHHMSASVKKEFNINTIFEYDKVYPLVVIGSGPAGLSAALYGAQQKLHPLLFKGGEPGGLLMKTTEVTNWPGEKSILGKDIIERLHEQDEQAGVQWRDDSVESIDVSHWPYTLYTQNGEVVHALAIIIATGARPRTLGISGEQEYWGAGVTTCAICDARFYPDQDSVVIGGGNSAIEEATQSAVHQKNVTMLVRKDHLRASATMQDRLKEYPNISVIYNVEVQEVLGETIDNRLHMTGVRLYNNTTGESYVIPAQMMYLAIGHVPNADFVAGVIDRTKQGYIKTNGKSQETSVQGIFAAGEVADDRYRQAAVSAGDGVKAALDAFSFLQKIGFTPNIAKKLEEMSK